MIGERIGDFFYQLSVLADNCKQREDFAATAASTASVHLLHQRFAHANCRDVARTIKSKAVKDTNVDRSIMENDSTSGNKSPESFIKIAADILHNRTALAKEQTEQ